MEHSSVMKHVGKRIGDDGDSVVAPALSFLFLLGRIDYHAKNDSFEYRSSALK